ncbi:MAG TPA: PilZ domain-containing protein [Bryobacteraceae bacterium]|nr:PilZ domain-containing protein [Bryobacteraceae bacterium]
MAWSEETNDVQSIAGDRRFDRRYQLRLELRWKLIRRRKIQDTGTGYTVDLSSGGILFDAGRPLPVGLNVELSIAWPVLLHNVAPMQLLVSGRVVRSVGNRVAVHAVQHEFRTLGIPTEHRQVLANANRTPGLLANSGLPNLNKMQ